MDTYELRLDGRTYAYTSCRVTLQSAAASVSRSLVRQWAEAYTTEPTWIHDQWGVPAALTRMDFTIRSTACAQLMAEDDVWSPDECEFGVYEIDDRPSGVGFAASINSQLRDRLRDVRTDWGRAVGPDLAPCVVMAANTHAGHYGDAVWINTLTLAEATAHNRLIIWRGDPGEDANGALASRTFSTWRSHMDKAYGERLGWWRPVVPSDLERDDDTIWSTNFVVKPVRGWGGRGVRIWIRRQDPLSNVGGASTKTKIRGDVKAQGRMYLQQFMAPLPCPFFADYRMILRLYYGYAPSKCSYIPLGGFWNARPGQLKVIGASDAIYGPLVIQP